MILRRITAHLREQHWTAIVIDFAIVVIGVFVGIQVSNANNDRIESKLQGEYAARIAADLDNIYKAANVQTAFEERKADQIKEAIALSREPASEDKALRLGTILTSLAIRRSPNYVSPTLNELQNSGRISLFHDPKLRNDLSVYFSTLQYRGDVIGRNNQAHVESYVDFLRREGIGMGYVATDIYPNSKLPEPELLAATRVRAMFGPRAAGDDSGVLRLPPSDPFWGRLRAALSWRGIASAANEAQTQPLAAEAIKMKREIERADLK